MIEFLEGNDAVVRAAIDAGCKFFAGYPITPASSILTGMMRELPKAGGVVVQGEDEIASIGMCIGASMTGLKAMTATSGPGISLYSENVGLAIMGETPLVIVNVQRQGPATGSATKGSDGDVEFMRWVTSGGLPMIVLAPENVHECYTLTVDAFNMAERYRTPVFVASQKEVGLTREVFDQEAARLEAPDVYERPVAPVDCVYEPHACALPSDVPAMSAIGGPHLVRYTTSTHDQRAYLA
jgi:2-oxoglutarate/2-oxoacid ferredoxin oxidoreductase subunit alpha